jgi:flagellar protein FlgJ
VQTFEALAQRAGLQPGTPEYARAAEEAMSGGGVEINMPGSAEEGAFEKKVGELQATSIGAIADMGITARRNRQTLNQLDTALAESAGGFEAGFKSALGDFGIATQGLTEIQAAEALISQLVPAQRPPGSGTMSDRDLELFKKSLPRLIQTPEGRRKIIENMKAINQYMIAEGDLADAVLDGTITRADYRERMRALGNPLAETAAPSAGAAPARRRFDAQGREIK